MATSSQVAAEGDSVCGHSRPSYVTYKIATAQ